MTERKRDAPGPGLESAALEHMGPSLTGAPAGQTVCFFRALRRRTKNTPTTPIRMAAVANITNLLR